MNKKYFFLILFALSYAIQGYTAEKVIFLTSAEYPPYFGEQLKNQGFITEAIRVAFSRVGYVVKVEFFPWARSEWMAKKGISDGMFASWHTEEREKWFVFSNPIPPPNIIGFCKRKDKKITFETYRDLRQYRIGYVFGYAYPKEFLEAEIRNVKSYVDETLIINLVQRKIDLAIIDKIQAEYLLKLKFPKQSDEFEFMEPPLELKQQYLVISKKTKKAQEIVSDFNRGLKLIKDDGTLQEILKKNGY